MVGMFCAVTFVPKASLVLRPRAPAGGKGRHPMAGRNGLAGIAPETLIPRPYCSNRSEPFERANHRASSHAGGREGIQAGIARRDCRRPISLIKLQALTAAEALRHEVRKAAWLRSDARRHLS